MKQAVTIENSNQTAVIDGLESEADFWEWIAARFQRAATSETRDYISGNDEITRAMVCSGMLPHPSARMTGDRTGAQAAMKRVSLLFRKIGREHGLSPSRSGQFFYVRGRPSRR